MGQTAGRVWQSCLRHYRWRHGLALRSLRSFQPPGIPPAYTFGPNTPPEPPEERLKGGKHRLSLRWKRRNDQFSRKFPSWTSLGSITVGRFRKFVCSLKTSESYVQAYISTAFAHETNCDAGYLCTFRGDMSCPKPPME